MHCANCRELISAQLDGELPVDEQAPLHAHLSGCADCRAFEARALAFTRATRLRSAEPVPDLAAAIVERARAATPTGADRAWVRYALTVVALTQLVLGAIDLLPMTGVTGSASIHLEHHLGAWDLAMAIGLLVVAWQPERARGLLPMALALGAILVVTAAADLAGGRTVPLTEAPHALELAGITLLWLLARSERWPRSPLPRWSSARVGLTT